MVGFCAGIFQLTGGGFLGQESGQPGVTHYSSHPGQALLGRQEQTPETLGVPAWVPPFGIPQTHVDTPVRS